MFICIKKIRKTIIRHQITHVCIQTHVYIYSNAHAGIPMDGDNVTFQIILKFLFTVFEILNYVAEHRNKEGDNKGCDMKY